MGRSWKIAICGALLALGAAHLAFAQDGSGAAENRQKKDAVCTKCPDESESKPILSIYQTAHGVSADARTPSCQSCHGDSDKHLAGNVEGKGRPAPDIVF